MNKNYKFRAKLPGSARRFELKTDGNDATLYVYGVIGADYWGDGISSTDFANAVMSAAGTDILHLRINSPGGDVFEGRAMQAALRGYSGTVVAHVDGLAASAATMLTSIADQVVMNKGAMIMIHNASSGAWGNATDLRATAALLEKIDGQIANDYATQTGKSVDDVLALMAAETWLTEDEAVAEGFATSVDAGDATQARAAWEISGDATLASRATALEATTAATSINISTLQMVSESQAAAIKNLQLSHLVRADSFTIKGSDAAVAVDHDAADREHEDRMRLVRVLEMN